VMVSYTAGSDVHYVGTDQEPSGFLATQHLVEAGRRRIGYIGDKFGSMTCELRGSGYRRALTQNGLSVDPSFLFEYPYEGEWNDFRSGYAIGERVAALAVKPDGVFVYNDLGALGFQDALLDHGIRVPDDIAVVGMDDVELAGRARVPLTTVRQPVEHIGALAVDSLLARLRGEQTETRKILQPELVVRRSSGRSPESANQETLVGSRYE